MRAAEPAARRVGARLQSRVACAVLATAALLLTAGPCLAQTQWADDWQSWRPAPRCAGGVLPPSDWAEIARLADRTTDRSEWLNLLFLARTAVVARETIDAYSPVGSHGRVLKAYAYFRQGEGARACEEARIALRPPATREAHMMLACGLAGQGLNAEAEVAAGGYIDLARWNPEAYHLRASLRDLLGDADGARQDRDRAARLLREVAPDPEAPQSGDGVLPAYQALLRDMSPRPRPDDRAAWGRWCNASYARHAAEILRAAGLCAASDERDCCDVGGSLLSWYGRPAAETIVLRLETMASPADPRESLLVPGGLDGFRLLLERTATQQVRRLAETATLPDVRAKALAVLAMRPEAVTAEQVRAIQPLTDSGWAYLAECWTRLGDADSARECARRVTSEPVMREGIRQREVHEIAAGLRRLRARRPGDACYQSALGARIAALSGGHPGSGEVTASQRRVAALLAPATGLAFPPARPVPRTAMDDVSFAAEGLSDPDTVAAAHARLLRFGPGVDLSQAAPWAELAVWNGSVRGRPDEAQFVLDLLEAYSPGGAFAWKLLYLENRRRSSPGESDPFTSQVYRDVGARLCLPRWGPVLEQARAWAPEVVEKALVEARASGTALAIEALTEDPDYAALGWGDRAASMAAAERYREQGHPVGELVLWFWNAYPEME